MLYTLTLDGIPMGHVDLRGAPRSVGTLVAHRAFGSSTLRASAKRVGLALRASGSPRIPPRAGARTLVDSLARAGQLQHRLGLVDVWGGHAAIVHVLVVEFPRDDWPLVVAELREQAAPRGAKRADTALDPGSRSRPAA